MTFSRVFAGPKTHLNLKLVNRIASPKFVSLPGKVLYFSPLLKPTSYLDSIYLQRIKLLTGQLQSFLG